MTSGIGTVGTVTGVAVTQSAVAPAAPVAQAPVATAGVPLTPSVPTPNQKIVFDPQAGLIDQYLNSKGTLQAQVPSAVVVAYLHAGLTAAGLPKPSSAGRSA